MSIDTATGVNRIYGPTGYPNYLGAKVANDDGIGYAILDIDLTNSETPLVTSGAMGDAVGALNPPIFPPGTAFLGGELHVLEEVTGVGNFSPVITNVETGATIALGTFAMALPVGALAFTNTFDIPDATVYLGYNATGATGGKVRIKVGFQVPGRNVGEV